MESDADRSFIDAAPLREGEQRHFGGGSASVPFLHIAFDPLSQLRSHRHDSTFVELRFADEQHIVREIGIGQLESSYFTYSQPQSLEQGEHGFVN
jgi:hypothetical protein